MTENAILKYLKGFSSKEETEELENWILASQDNTDFFEKIKLDFIMNTFDETSKETATDQTYQDFHHRYMGKKSSYRSLSPIFKYAAVALILIASGYFIHNSQGGDQIIDIPEDAITLELENGDIRIIDENGIVKVHDAKGKVVGKQEGGSLIYSGSSEKEELAFNTLTIPYGRTFQLELSDGTIAHLNAGSSVRYPIQFLEGMERQIFVTGEAYLDVAEDKQHPFIVNAKELNVRVLGTEFNVSAYPEDETTEIVLVEGSVSLYTDNEVYENGKNTLLESGYKASFDKTNESIAKEAVSTGIYTSWRNGELVFRDMTFENILKKLERRYDVTITNDNMQLSREKFQASFGELPPIEMVLDELKEVYDIDYSINGNKITIK